MDALGGDYRVVVTHSDRFHAKQSRGFDQTLAKAVRQLGELADRLGRGKTRRTGPVSKRRSPRIIAPGGCPGSSPPRSPDDVPVDLRLTFASIPKPRALEDELFGKRVLFTDREDWLDRRRRRCLSVPAPRRGRLPPDEGPQGRLVLPDVPLDREKIRVHVFYCVLALTVARLMRREANRPDST